MRQGLILIIGLIAGILLYGGYHSYQDKGKPEMINAADTAKPVLVTTGNDFKSDVYKSRHTAITRAVAAVSPAVVTVNVRSVRERIERSPFSDDPFFRQFFPEIFKDRRYQERLESLGSGYIISEDGYVVTNQHVIGEGGQITVSLSSGEESKADIIGVDKISDICLLKISEEKKFSYVRFGDSENLVIGEWAIALGNPFGLFKRSQPTVTVGVVSAINRDFGRIEGRVYLDMIQTDASINNGNSGGPLCNAVGEVIGMNTFIYTGDQYEHGNVGIGFAIPSNHIRVIINALKTSGKIDRDFSLGMQLAPFNSYFARRIGYPDGEGVYVVQLDPKSSAAKAGIRLGDVVADINDVSVHDEDSFEQAISTDYFKVGDKIKLKIWRDNKYENYKITLEKRR